MQKNKIIIAIVAVAVVVGSAGFYAGMRYQKAKQPNRVNFSDIRSGRGTQALGMMNNMMGGRMQGGVGRGQGAEGMVVGEIIAKDENSVTVKLRDGGSKILFLSGTTQVVKPAITDATVLEVGNAIFGVGTPNADGSVTAQSIQVQIQQTGSTTPEVVK